MITGTLTLFAGAIVAKAALDAWFIPDSSARARDRGSVAAHAPEARGGFLRGVR
jgi:hypothetical protein